ncbi:MAG: response regulator transcription factor, partial [Rhodocyclaceae bacterium]|nr:response regulator transcription factor [Rhodocyclaceae bacterium]
LPKLSGIEVCRRIRGKPETRNMPIIMLTARGEESDRIRGLDTGADDYLTKPFGSAELLARVRAQLRRRSSTGSSGATVFEFGKIRVDLGKRIVERLGEPLHLTPIEYRLLAYLITHPDSVLTHRQLLKNVWGPSHADDSHYVRVYMGHLRRKIEDNPSQPRHVLTEAGVGYRFVAQAASA